MSTSSSKPGNVQATPVAAGLIIAPAPTLVASPVGHKLHGPHLSSIAVPANGSGRIATSSDQQSRQAPPETTSGFASELDAVPFLNKLTPTERKVLRLIADNRTSKDIAGELFSSVRTIENHRARIRAKLGLSGSNALMWFAAEHQHEIRRESKDS